MKSIASEILTFAESLAGLFYPLVEVKVFSSDNQLLAEFNPLPSKKEMRERQLPLGDYKLHLKYDLSPFHRLQKEIETITGKEFEAISEEPMGEKQIEKWIENYFKERHLTVEGASKEEKRKLVHELYEKEAFAYKEASKVIATKLDLSRATVYNYLNQAMALSGIEVHQVDAFTEKRFEGNPAGVVLDADPLSVNVMRQIAREMNLSETAFVLASEKGDFRLRYFTPPGDEVVFCGHSTVGALYMLAHQSRLGMTKPGIYEFRVETHAGILPMRIKKTKEEQISVTFETPPILLGPTDLHREEICEALGLPFEEIEDPKALFWEKTNSDLFIPLRSLKFLGSFEIDQKKAEAFARAHGIVAFCLYTREALHASHDIHMRCYAPAVGIPEDPFTGSVLGGLAASLYKRGFLKDGESFAVEQGHFIKRPGHVKVSFSLKKNKPTAWVEAKAIHLFSTRIHLR